MKLFLYFVVLLFIFNLVCFQLLPLFLFFLQDDFRFFYDSIYILKFLIDELYCELFLRNCFLRLRKSVSERILCFSVIVLHHYFKFLLDFSLSFDLLLMLLFELFDLILSACLLALGLFQLLSYRFEIYRIVVHFHFVVNHLITQTGGLNFTLYPLLIELIEDLKPL